MRSIFFLLLMLMASAYSWANQPIEKIESILREYDQAGRKERLDIANNFFKANEDYCEEKISFDGNSKPEYVDGMLYYWAADMEYNNGKFREAAITVEKSLKAYSSVDDDEARADALSLAILAWHRLGDYTKAMEYAEETLKLDRKSGKSENIAMTLNMIAGTNLAANNAKAGVRYILEALSIDRKIGDKPALARHLGIASEIYMKIGQLDEALKHATEAVAIERENGDEGLVAVRMSQLGGVFVALKRINDARTTLLAAKGGLEKSGNSNSLSITLNQLAENELNDGKNGDAVKYLMQSLPLCRKTGNRHQLANTYHRLYEALKETDIKQASTFLEQYTSLEDSLYNEKCAQQLELFNVKYDVAEKENMIRTQKDELMLHRILVAGLVIAVIVIIVIALLLWRLAHNRGKMNKIMVKANMAKNSLMDIANDETAKEEMSPNLKDRILEVASDMENIGEMPEIKLTRREKQVMDLFCQGKIAKEIADEMGISVRTVETHKNHIYHKLGINNTVELLRYAHLVSK